MVCDNLRTRFLTRKGRAEARGDVPPSAHFSPSLLRYCAAAPPPPLRCCAAAVAVPSLPALRDQERRRRRTTDLPFGAPLLRRRRYWRRPRQAPHLGVLGLRATVARAATHTCGTSPLSSPSFWRHCPIERMTSRRSTRLAAKRREGGSDRLAAKGGRGAATFSRE